MLNYRTDEENHRVCTSGCPESCNGTYPCCVFVDSEALSKEEYKMKVTYQESETLKRIEIYPFDGEMGGAITVRSDYGRFGSKEWDEPTINWPAIGSVPVEDLNKFLEGLNRARVFAMQIAAGMTMSEMRG